MRLTTPLVGFFFTCVCTIACKQDSVLPNVVGYPAGAPVAGSRSIAGNVMGAAGSAGTSVAGMSGGSGAGAAGMPGAAGSSHVETASAAGKSGGADSSNAVSMAGSAGATNTAGASPSGRAGMSGSEGTAGMNGSGGSGGASVLTPSDEPCDLAGRWMATVHAVTDALGQQQTTHVFVYYEIARQGDGYTIAKGLHCADEGVAEGLFAVTVSFKGSANAVMQRVSYLGRGVSSTPAANGCNVHFDKWYTVRGATLPYYLDPTNPLPTAGQAANGTMPGWEDWDQDGQPGLTGLLMGTVTGKIFVAPRQWTELSGTVPDTTSRFRLPLQWDQQQNVMAFDPPDSFLLGSEAVRAADPSLHFAEFARLSPEQATGEDSAICSEVIKLAPMLTPAAAKI